VLRSDVEEVSLNVTVLNGAARSFRIQTRGLHNRRDGVPQTLPAPTSGHPVSSGLVVDNPARCTKAPAVNKSALDSDRSLKPAGRSLRRELADEAYHRPGVHLDANKLRTGCYIESRGHRPLTTPWSRQPTNLPPTPNAPKQVIVIITTGRQREQP